MEIPLRAFSQRIEIYTVTLGVAAIVIGLVITTAHIAYWTVAIAICSCRSLDTIDIRILFAGEKRNAKKNTSPRHIFFHKWKINTIL